MVCTHHSFEYFPTELDDCELDMAVFSRVSLDAMHSHGSSTPRLRDGGMGVATSRLNQNVQITKQKFARRPVNTGRRFRLCELPIAEGGVDTTFLTLNEASSRRAGKDVAPAGYCSVA
jgi:hypothetical protein